MASRVIAPSILAADHARFGEEARRAELAGGDWLHVDVMDGHFVPNISFGPEVTAALKRSTSLPLDVHLMIEQPDRYVDAFVKAGAARITAHVEARHDVRKTLNAIRTAGCGTGLALNPATDSSAVTPYLAEVDLVLCMTVVPGFGGQAFMPAMLEKIAEIARHPARTKNHYFVEVDGGIQIESAAACAKAGADVFVVGTSLFRATDMKQTMAAIRNVIQPAG